MDFYFKIREDIKKPLEILANKHFRITLKTESFLGLNFYLFIFCYCHFNYSNDGESVVQIGTKKRLHINEQIARNYV